MKFLTAAFVMLWGIVGQAQFSQSFNSCNKVAESQSAINRCAIEELKRADSELDDRNRKLSAAIGGDKQAQDKVKAMQAAWVAYRDAYMEAIFPADDKAYYGSIYPSSAALTQARITRQQIAAVGRILDELKPR